MLDVVSCIKDTLFFEVPGFLEKSLSPVEVFLGSDMFSRTLQDKTTIYYLDSSDQIEIPREYLNLFQALNVRYGDRLRGQVSGEDLDCFVSLGIELPGILLHQTDSRGIRNIISRAVLLGTSGLRTILPTLRPWVLSNINSTLEI